MYREVTILKIYANFSCFPNCLLHEFSNKSTFNQYMDMYREVTILKIYANFSCFPNCLLHEFSNFQYKCEPFLYHLSDSVDYT